MAPVLWLLIFSTAQAQFGLQPLSGLAAGSSADPNSGKELKASGYFTVGENGQPATLYVTAELAPGWHTYSITQAPGGPNKTRIKLADSAGYKLAGDFKANPPPTVHHYDDIWPNLVVEEHEGQVTWSAPIEIAAAANPSQLEIAGAVNAQVCAKDCLPPTDYKFVARLKAGSAVATMADIKPAAVESGSSPAMVLYKPKHGTYCHQWRRSAGGGNTGQHCAFDCHGRAGGELARLRVGGNRS